MKIFDFLINNKICKSKAETKRLFYQKAIFINDNVINNQDYILNNEDKIRVGKNKNLIYIEIIDE